MNQLALVVARTCIWMLTVFASAPAVAGTGENRRTK
jgi:hypothetical protein